MSLLLMAIASFYALLIYILKEGGTLPEKNGPFANCNQMNKSMINFTLDPLIYYPPDFQESEEYTWPLPDETESSPLRKFGHSVQILKLLHPGHLDHRATNDFAPDTQPLVQSSLCSVATVEPLYKSTKQPALTQTANRESTETFNSDIFIDLTPEDNPVSEADKSSQTKYKTSLQRRESKARYAKTYKGRVSKARYASSDKGKVSQARRRAKYLASDKGKKNRANYLASRKKQNEPDQKSNAQSHAYRSA